MREVPKAFNRLVEDRVVRAYAIGGAIGAAFHIRPTGTEDIDVFVVVPQTAGLVSLSNIYRALEKQGGEPRGAYVQMGEWPVQILTDADPLTREAIERAIDVTYEGVPTRVFTAEHLVAIALQTGRPKDLARVSMFFEQQAVDRRSLDDILKRHNLSQRLPNAYKEQDPSPGR
jgi:hypothetical protein